MRLEGAHFFHEPATGTGALNRPKALLIVLRDPLFSLVFSNGYTPKNGNPKKTAIP